MFQPPHPFHLRPLTVADLPTVLAIEQHSFPTPTKEATYRYELLENQLAQYRGLVMYSGSERERLVGYAGTWLLVDEVHISIIAVDPALRRQGLGELLLLDLLYMAVTQEAALVTLEVREGNLAAQQLYSKYGFAVVGRRRGYYRDTGEDAVLMTVELRDNPAYQAFLDAQRGRLLARLPTAPE